MKRIAGIALVVVLLLIAGANTLCAPSLDLSLLVDGSLDRTTYVGWPMLFELSLANQGAINDALFNEQIQATLDALEVLLADGQIQEAEAQRVRATLELREIEPVIVGSERVPWDRLVRFEDSHGALPWSVVLLAEGVPVRLALDDRQMAVASYAVSPNDSGRIAPGRYLVRVVISTEGVRDLPDGHWMGTVTSEAVPVTVLPEPTMTDALRVQKGITFGRYAFYTSDYAAAEAYLQASVDLDPSDIEARVWLGDAQMAQGKMETALGTYYGALVAYEAVHGALADGHAEPPAYIIERIAQVQALIRSGPSVSSP